MLNFKRPSGPAKALIEPQYVEQWNRYVEPLLMRRLAESDVHTAVDRLLEEFELGMCSQQNQQSLQWMLECLDQSGITKTDAAERLRVNRGHFGRWLRGDNDLPFQRFQQFYVQIGLSADKDCPFRDKHTLHLGGYLRAVSFVRDHFLSDLPRYLQETTPTLEVIICLYYFYANLDPMKGFMERHAARMKLPNSVLRETLNVLRQYLPMDSIQLGSTSDLGRILGTWGTSWLLCIRLLAEEAGGITPYYVSARRPIRLGDLEVLNAN